MTTPKPTLRVEARDVCCPKCYADVGDNCTRWYGNQHHSERYGVPMHSERLFVAREVNAVLARLTVAQP